MLGELETVDVRHSDADGVSDICGLPLADTLLLPLDDTDALCESDDDGDVDIDGLDESRALRLSSAVGVAQLE